MKKITPIAMRCNKEQFEAIKSKLKGMGINSVTCFSDYPYLTNVMDNLYAISNISMDHFGNTWKSIKKIHETWNERIFLEACGIETEETFEITKETIIKYKMKDEFPEVFEVKLENNTWYVCHHYRSRYLINLTLTDESDTHNKGFGFDGHGNWNNNLSFLKAHDYRFKEATEQEVFEALKNEADKIGYKEGNYDCLTSFGNVLAIDSYFLDKDSMGNFELWKGKNCDANCIFKNGKWAKIIPTCTREEAEKLLNCKIID